MNTLKRLKDFLHNLCFTVALLGLIKVKSQNYQCYGEYFGRYGNSNKERKTWKIHINNCRLLSTHLVILFFLWTRVFRIFLFIFLFIFLMPSFLPSSTYITNDIQSTEGISLQMQTKKDATTSSKLHKRLANTEKTDRLWRKINKKVEE